MRGIKKIEYRNMLTKIRGRVQIYASLGRYPAEVEAEMLEEYGIEDVTCDDLPRGVLIGTVEIINCTEDDGEFHWHIGEAEAGDSIAEAQEAAAASLVQSILGKSSMLPYETINEDVIQIVSRGSAKLLAAFQDTQHQVESYYRIYYVPKRGFAKPHKMQEMKATPTEILQVQITTVQTLHGKRLAEQLLDCIHALNEKRLYQLALSTRSVIEVVASLVSFETKVSALLIKGITTQSESDFLNDLIDKAIRGGRFDWTKWLRDDSRSKLVEAYAEYARGAKEPKPEIEQTNVLTMVRSLGKRMSEQNPADEGLVELVYGLLSDICHPAAGGNILQLANHLSEDWWQLGTGVSDDLLRWFCLCATVPVLARVCEACTRSLNQLTALCKTISVGTSGPNLGQT